MKKETSSWSVNALKEFEEIVELMDKLRSKNGCPWDREQTMDTMKTNLMNEAEEVKEAIEKKDYKNLKEELGDLFWAIVFISQIAKEDRLFDIGDVLKSLRKKMVRRHPHVFGDLKAHTPEDAKKIFYSIKQKEKENR